MYQPLAWEGMHKRFNAGKPFPHVVLKHVLSPSTINALRWAVERVPKKRWNTDLYQFWQTDDLKKSSDPTVQKFVKWWASLDTKDAVCRIAGVKVPGPVDIAGFVYKQADYLLPHDDRMPGRKVAYVLYLTSSKKGGGGELDLFETDAAGKPMRVSKSVAPVAGQLVLFSVSRHSYHQVAEQLSKRPRVTIGGWFNG